MGHEEDEDEDEPRPVRRSRRNALPPPFDLVKILQIVRMAAWGALFLATGCGGLMFCSALGRSSSAPQEAAVGAIFATVFIGLYILTRCVDSFLEIAERVRPKPSQRGNEERDEG